MEAIIYILIFVIGTLFGSFYTLAVYRIPKKQDILVTHSYCPNCNHKLGFFDLFPIISYICLGGKCRYCKEAIRPRYLIIEVISGIFFVLVAYALKINVYAITLEKIVQFIFMVLYLTYIILICGIDRENKRIDKNVNIYGIAISIIYMIYLCIVEGANIYRYVIYLVAYVIILIFDTVTLKEYAKSRYVDGVLMSIVIMAIFTGEYITASSIILTLLAISIYLLLYKLKKGGKRRKVSDKQISNKIGMGFYLGASNIILLIISLLYNQYIM